MFDQGQSIPVQIGILLQDHEIKLILWELIYGHRSWATNYQDALRILVPMYISLVSHT